MSNSHAAAVGNRAPEQRIPCLGSVPAPLPGEPTVHVVQHLAPGGLEVAALELARVQAAAGATVHIISLEGSERAAIDAWPRLARSPVPLHFLGKRPGVDISLPSRLARTLEHLGFGSGKGIIQTHHIGPLLYGGTAARLSGRRVHIHTEHDAWHLSSRKRRALVRAGLEIARPVLVADSEAVAARLELDLGMSPHIVIPNGVDTDLFRPGDRTAARASLGLPPEATIVGVSARLEHVKGVDVAINAIAVMDEAPILALAGTGSESGRLRELAASITPPGRVVFLGHVDSMPAFYQALDALCLPSRNEGLPLAILEAQSCGTPVVACDVGGVSEGLDGRTGWLCPPENPEFLAVLIRKALDQTAPNPRQFVMERYSLAAVAAAYERVAKGDLRRSAS